MSKNSLYSLLSLAALLLFAQPGAHISRVAAQSLPNNPRFYAPGMPYDLQVQHLKKGGPDWNGYPNGVKTYCDTNRDHMIQHDYAGYGDLSAVYYYKLCELVETDQAAAAIDRKKGLAALEQSATNFAYDPMAPDYKVANSVQVIGLGDGVKKSFPLTKTPKPGTPVYVVEAGAADKTYPCTLNVNCYYDGAGKLTYSYWGYAHIFKVKDQTGHEYTNGIDFHMRYNVGYGAWGPAWIGDNRPDKADTLTVTAVTGEPNPPGYITGGWTVVNNTLTFDTAPADHQAIGVSYLANDYSQTSNGLGMYGNNVQPDARYWSRSEGVALALGIDSYIKDLPANLKTQYLNTLFDELDDIQHHGYCLPCFRNNYFFGHMQFTFMGAYAALRHDSRAAQYVTIADKMISDSAADLSQLSGGYGYDGQYTNGVAAKLMEIGLSQKILEGSSAYLNTDYIKNTVVTQINLMEPAGTQADGQRHFYGGDDWSTLPAHTLVEIFDNYAKYNPDTVAAGYARQAYLDITGKRLDGVLRNYKLELPLAWQIPSGGIVTSRSSWTDKFAVWWANHAKTRSDDHHRAQDGAFYISRGSDQLIPDVGGYGSGDIKYFTTMVFDDRTGTTPGLIPCYGDNNGKCPGEPYQNFNHPGDITRFKSDPNYVYAQDEYATAYANRNGQNEVKRATRMILDMKPFVGIFDATQVATASTRSIFNLNFAAKPYCTTDCRLVTGGNGDYKLTLGDSALFMKVLTNNALAPTLSELRGDQSLQVTNYREQFTGQTNSFCHVLEATDKTQAAMDPITGFNGTDNSGCGFAFDNAGKHKVGYFVNDGVRSSFSLSTNSGEQYKMVFGGLADGPYTVTLNGAAQDITSDQGSLSLDYTATGTTTQIDIVRANFPSLKLTKMADRATVDLGGIITYTLTYENNGTNNLDHVQLNDPVPAGALFVSASDGGVNTNGVVTWDIGSLAVGAKATRTFTVEVPDPNATPLHMLLKLNEQSGTRATDSTAYANHGTISGATPGTGGDINSYVFNGTNAVISVPNTSSLNPTSSISVTAWVKYNTVGGYAPGIVTKAKASLDGFYLGLFYTDHTKLNFGLNLGGAWDGGVTSKSHNDSQWHLVVGTYNGSVINIYVDGVLEGTKSASGAIKVNSNPILIGRWDDGTANGYYKGLVDDASVYAKALTPSEITALYQAGRSNP